MEIARRPFNALIAGGLALLGASPGRLGAATARQSRGWGSFLDDDQWHDFELVTGNTILVPAEVAGLHAEAMLDSGSHVSMVSRRLAERAGLTGTARTIRGNSGRAQASAVEGLAVKLLGAQQTLPLAVITDLDVPSAAFGRQLDLIAGEDTLAGRCVAIDFAARRIATALSGRFTGGAGWTSAPVSHGGNGELLVPASVNGRTKAPFIFDLGSSTGVTLSGVYVKEQGIIGSRRTSTAAVGGVEGMREAAVFTVDDLEVAGSVVRHVPALAADPWLSSSAVGNIGLPAIAQFDVVLDISAGTVWLRGGPDPRRPPMLKDRSGLGLQALPDGLLIVHVARGSPAESAALRAGEKIVAVDGKPVDATYTRGDLWRWRFRPPGTPVKLQLSAERQILLRLADYY